jgi:hypothetical protein
MTAVGPPADCRVWVAIFVQSRHSRMGASATGGSHQINLSAIPTSAAPASPCARRTESGERRLGCDRADGGGDAGAVSVRNADRLGVQSHKSAPSGRRG